MEIEIIQEFDDGFYNIQINDTQHYYSLDKQDLIELRNLINEIIE